MLNLTQCLWGTKADVSKHEHCMLHALHTQAKIACILSSTHHDIADSLQRAFYVDFSVLGHPAQVHLRAPARMHISTMHLSMKA